MLDVRGLTVSYGKHVALHDAALVPHVVRDGERDDGVPVLHLVIIDAKPFAKADVGHG